MEFMDIEQMLLLHFLHFSLVPPGIRHLQHPAGV